VTKGIPLVMPQNIGDNEIIKNGISMISQEDADRLAKYKFYEGDIVYSRRGDVTKRAYIKKENEGWICGTGCLLIRAGKGNINTRFLAYQLGTPIIREWIQRHAIGATMPNLNTAILSDIPLSLPELEDQNRIANILGALDDKIELNHRMNRTLESMARAMFTEISNNNIPPKIIKLGDICEFVYGKSLIDKDRIMGNIPVIGSNGQIGWHDQALVQGPGIVVGRKGNPGTVTWVNTDFFPIDTTFYINVKTTEINLYWLFFALKSLNLPSLNADSAVPGLNRNIAYQSELVFPPKEKVQSFLRYVKPIFSLIENNNSEVVLLKLIRDIAIKRLISSNLY
jgi:type I restriction enzyme S subunit